MIVLYNGFIILAQNDIIKIKRVIVYKILKEQFGFNEFKPIQKKAIQEILQKKDLLVILPTGSGKSLIYQLPTMMMDGVSIVISPLIALMQDQVSSLRVNGINAKMISSSNTQKENAQTMDELLNNKLKFLYVAPERFVNEYFLQNLKRVEINFFVIDEAHCVSEWGHEFRDDYRKLQYLKEWFEDTPITAFTATATKTVQSDILKTLKIDKKQVLRAKANRDNLIIRSQKRIGNAKEQIIEFLNTHKDESGIIYCFTRKETERLSGYLNDNGFDTGAYHAGLSVSKREKIFKDFKNDSLKIIVATIAFGMGIDKSNIRFVLHTSMPKTIENYFQEIGRAGRDGLMSDTLLLYSKADEISKRVFIDELPESEYKRNIYEKLRQMYRFAISSKCRHQSIAKYFGDEIQKCEIICDNCLDKDVEFLDITLEAQKFISTILRCKERFGSAYIIDVLRGSRAKRILDFGHDKLSVYGIGQDLSKLQWGSIFDRLLDEEALYIDKEFGSLKVTNIAKQILKKEKTININARNLEIKKSFKEYKKDENTNETFEKLRELRTTLAKKDDVPAYVIFSDKTLLEISKKLPASKDEFLQISGVGGKKLERYGKEFLKLCKDIKEITPKELSKTYKETLLLIKEGKNISEICEKRELKDTTIISHVIALYENNQIDKIMKNTLLQPLIDNFPKDIKSWIEDGLKLHNISKLRQNIAKYEYLFMFQDKNPADCD